MVFIFCLLRAPAGVLSHDCVWPEPTPTPTQSGRRNTIRQKYTIRLSHSFLALRSFRVSPGRATTARLRLGGTHRKHNQAVDLTDCVWPEPTPTPTQSSQRKTIRQQYTFRFPHGFIARWGHMSRLINRVISSFIVGAKVPGVGSSLSWDQLWVIFGFILGPFGVIRVSI